MKIGIVAGEASGDLIASRLMAGFPSLPDSAPAPVWEGVGGAAMAAQGFQSLYPMEALSVFGYAQALRQLLGILRAYYGLRRHWSRALPDVMVGVDAPDFNLRLERDLRERGVPTVHYVSPSIWAWRYERINQIGAAVSHMLCLFPFEVPLYEKKGIPVTFVGHPLASQIPEKPDMQGARKRLGLPPEATVLALLPGSRRMEVQQLSQPFLESVAQLQKAHPDLQVVVPFVNDQREAEFKAILAQYPIENIHFLRGQGAGYPIAWDAMESADAVLTASGTASLEAALFQKPMVIAYKLSPLATRLMRWKAGRNQPLLPWVGLPNILLEDFVVPECLQEEASAQVLVPVLNKALWDTGWRSQVQSQFARLHGILRADTPQRASQAILSVLK